MPLIRIDDKEYELDALSEVAKANLASVRFADTEIERLTSQLAVVRTARNAYAQALQRLLPQPD